MQLMNSFYVHASLRIYRVLECLLNPKFDNILFTPDRRHAQRRRIKIKEEERKKANELKQHNHLRFKTAKSGVPLDKRNFLSSLCVPVPDSQVDELYPKGDRGEIAQHGGYF